MDLEKIKGIIEFKNDCDFIANMKWKFNFVSGYRNMIILLDPNKQKSNIEAVVNEVRKVGYELNNITDYNSLYNALTEVLITINKQVNDYLLKKVFDKALEKNIKTMFDIKSESKDKK